MFEANLGKLEMDPNLQDKWLLGLCPVRFFPTIKSENRKWIEGKKEMEIW